jgi:hypothetical protein
MRGVDELLNLVAPPAAPNGPPFDWDAAETELGTALPNDYKAYCDRYGHGELFNGWLWQPLTPFAQHREDDLTHTFWRDILADHFPKQRPFPEPRGVLPFLYCERKYRFWWRVDGPPDHWPVLLEDDGGGWTEHTLTATELLARALRDEIWGPPDDDLELTEFIPYRPRTPEPRQPFVIASSGSSYRESFAHDTVFCVHLDLGGALGGTREQRFDELLAALDGSIRTRIVGAEAKRSEELLYVRSGAGFDAVCEAVQAWADRVSGWT